MSHEWLDKKIKTRKNLYQFQCAFYGLDFMEYRKILYGPKTLQDRNEPFHKQKGCSI